MSESRAIALANGAYPTETPMDTLFAQKNLNAQAFSPDLATNHPLQSWIQGINAVLNPDQAAAAATTSPDDQKKNTFKLVGLLVVSIVLLIVFSD